MSDRIAIMKNGLFEQIAGADEIYGRPVSRFVAEFMGEVNLFPVVSEDGKTLSGAGLSVKPGLTQDALPAGGQGLLMVRPEYVRFADDTAPHDYTVKGRVLEEYALGSRIQYQVETAGGQILTVEKLREERLAPDADRNVTLGFDMANTHVIGDS